MEEKNLQVRLYNGGRQDARLPQMQDACATKNFVISCEHDPRDRVAGDVSHQRDDRISCGSTERF
jgi:hypothetical protein